MTRSTLPQRAPRQSFHRASGVEPIGTRSEVATRNPPAGGNKNRSTLSSSNGVQGMSERRPVTPFYLHKRNDPILFHHQIDLLAEETNVALKDSPSSLVQEGLGQRFEPASAAYGVQGDEVGRRSGGSFLGGDRNRKAEPWQEGPWRQAP